jgi:hypothetical protein
MADSKIFSDAGATCAPIKKRRLSTTAADLLAEQTGDLPVWIRSPKVGVERYTSLSRAKLYQLAGEGKIKSASLREPGRVRGCRLFHLASILAYIESNQV